MAMEVHNAFKQDKDCFIKECAHLFHNRWPEGHLSLSSCIQFFRQHVNIIFQHALTSAIKRKITLVGDVCSRHPITIRSHDLHACDIKKVVDEIIFYQERDQLSPFFWFLRAIHLLAFSWPSLFVSPMMVLAIDLLLDSFALL